MAYNYLTLVNDVCARVNETQLTSSNFASAVGFYATAKEAVNSAIRTINQEQYMWPFNHTDYDETLVAGTNRYAFQSDAKVVDFDSFRIQRDGTIGNESRKLKKIDYEEYLERYVDDEYNTSNTGIRALPRYVFQTPDQGYGVYPLPDAAYTLSYEYYALPTDLSAYSDAPSIPVAFRTAIVNGAMYFVYLFRGDYESADRIKMVFDNDVKNLRSIYINSYDHVRDTRVDSFKYVNTLRTN